MTNLHTDVRFSIVPEWVIDANISDRAVRVYALLARYADSETLQAFPSRETLAKRARCHWRSIDRAIDELVKLGAITKTHRKHGDSYQSNIYTLRRVLPGMSLPTDNTDKKVLTPVALPTDTDGNLTITTELEPLEQKPITKKQPKNADEYQPSQAILNDMETVYVGLRLDNELAKFRDHHMANGSQFKDWDRAFRGWLRRASEWSKEAKAARAWAEFDKATLEEEN